MTDKEVRAAFADMSPVIYKTSAYDEEKKYRYIDTLEYQRSENGKVTVLIGLNDRRRMDKSCQANSLIMTSPKNIYDGGAAEPESAVKCKKEKPKAHRYGQYNNVMLTDDELRSLQEKLPRKTEFNEAWDYWVERLSEHMKSKGKGYANHYATVCKWAGKHERERRAAAEKRAASAAVVKRSKFNNYVDSNKQDYSDFGKKILEDMLKEAEE